MDRGAWQAAVHGVSKELDATQQLDMHFFFLIDPLTSYSLNYIRKKVKMDKAFEPTFL